MGLGSEGFVGKVGRWLEAVVWLGRVWGTIKCNGGKGWDVGWSTSVQHGSA